MTVKKEPKNVEICTFDALFPGVDVPDGPMAEALVEYLAIFAKPIIRDNGNAFSGTLECLNCGVPLNGLWGSFIWGLANGEGNCGNCGWPCRAVHRPKDNGIEMFDRPMEIILQYHPSRLVEKEE